MKQHVKQQMSYAIYAACGCCIGAVSDESETPRKGVAQFIGGCIQDGLYVQRMGADDAREELFGRCPKHRVRVVQMELGAINGEGEL